MDQKCGWKSQKIVFKIKPLKPWGQSQFLHFSAKSQKGNQRQIKVPTMLKSMRWLSSVFENRQKEIARHMYIKHRLTKNFLNQELFNSFYHSIISTVIYTAPKQICSTLKLSHNKFVTMLFSARGEALAFPPFWRHTL